MAQIFQLRNCGAQLAQVANSAPDGNCQKLNTYLSVLPFTPGSNSQSDIPAACDLPGYGEFLMVFAAEAFGTQSDLSGNRNTSLHGG